MQVLCFWLFLSFILTAWVVGYVLWEVFCVLGPWGYEDAGLSYPVDVVG